MNGNNAEKAGAAGPLRGIRVLEFAGLGPAPFACMQLADMGADIVTLVRPGGAIDEAPSLIGRGRHVCEADLKDAAARDQVLELLERCDVLVEGFRPGVMERLGLGPDDVLARNPRLVYARMTGWGQQGPLAHVAGHDLNYIAMTGALHATGSASSGPCPPLNLLGDYGGGSMYLIVGILAALLERQGSGRGQVVDAAITDGVLSMMTLSCAQAWRGEFSEQRQSNLLDGGTPWYGVYETADGKHISVAALEPQFFATLCERVGLDPSWQAARNDRARWGALRAEFSRVFASRTRDEWTALLASIDACVAPVLTLSEALRHPQHAGRGAVVEMDGVPLPAPAPRFSRTPSSVQSLAPCRLDGLGAARAKWSAARPA